MDGFEVNPHRVVRTGRPQRYPAAALISHVLVCSRSQLHARGCCRDAKIARIDGKIRLVGRKLNAPDGLIRIDAADAGLSRQ